MPAPLLTTKLYIPPIRSELVPRPRLIGQLDAGLRHKLTLISAPPGFGKTALVAEWLHGAEQPVAWVSLDGGDNDPMHFFTYLIAALQTLDPDLGQAAQGLSGSPQLPPLETLMTMLINDIVATPTPPLAISGQGFVLVLDDYHTIVEPAIHKTMGFLLERQPPQMHMVFVTRQDPPLPLSRLRAHGQMTEIRASDLQFTNEQAAVFLNQTLGLNLTPDEIAALNARTEGWIAGLQLAALSMRGQAAERIADFITDFSGSHRHVIDYLAEEVLAQQTKEIRDFLRQTAILDHLTAPLCDTVTEQTNSKAILAQLEQANLFLIPLDDQRKWYRYHHLFAEFLRSASETRDQAVYHRRAAHWYEAVGLMTQAVRHALAYSMTLGDMDEAVRVIALAAPQVLSSGSLATLLSWLDALPNDVVRANSDLATCKGWVLLLRGQLEAAKHYASLAETSLPADAAPLRRGRLIGLCSFFALYQYDHGKALRLARKALNLLKEADPFFRYSIMSNLGDAQKGLGDIEGAAQTYREIIHTGQRLGNYFAAGYAVFKLATQLDAQGKLCEALALCQHAVDQYVDAHGKPLPGAGIIYLELGLLDYKSNNLERAGQHLDIGMALCQQLALPAYIVAAKELQAQIQQAMGETEAALAALNKAHLMAFQTEYAGYADDIAASLADLHLTQGNLAAAERWGETTSSSHIGPPKPGYETSYLVYAHLLLAQGRPKEAQTRLERLEESSRLGGCYGALITIHILQALTQQTLGDKDQAVGYIEKALEYAAPEGYYRAFLDKGQPVAKLLRLARPRFCGRRPSQITVATFVDRLLKAFHKEYSATVTVHDVSSIPQPLVDSLSERELQVLRLVAQGASNRAIAESLVVSIGTIKTHVSHIMGKLGASNRTEAVARARKLGIL